jgi:mycothiol synthase
LWAFYLGFSKIGVIMTNQPFTSIRHRALQGKDDAMRLRQLLIDSYKIMGREFNWETRRWEGSFWYTSDTNLANPDWGANTHIWENAEGLIVGAAVPDGPGDVALQIHPEYRELEDDILQWSEENLTTTNDAGQHKLFVWTFDWDDNRQERLARRGYQRHNDWFWQYRRRDMSDPVPECKIAEGYTIRSLEATMDDTRRWVTCTGIVFGHSNPPEHYRNFQLNSPSHNYDLHIVSETPDGSIAAFAGLTVDEENRSAVFEPVGTHPDHRRQGLARGVMYEGLRRLQKLETADVVYVANWGPADSAKLYAAVGMEHYATPSAWIKTL